jgi:hypothetical protein
MSAKQKRSTPVFEARPNSITVGSDVNASCAKCRSVTVHVVMTKVGSVPARVQCHTCQSLHAYRAPRQPVVRAAAAAVRTVEEIWQDAMKRCRSAVVPYSVRGHYAVGSRLTHLSFGEGVVCRLQSATVCEVIFERGTVKLLMGSAR